MEFPIRTQQIKSDTGENDEKGVKIIRVGNIKEVDARRRPGAGLLRLAARYSAGSQGLSATQVGQVRSLGWDLSLVFFHSSPGLSTPGGAQGNALQCTRVLREARRVLDRPGADWRRRPCSCTARRGRNVTMQGHTVGSRRLEVEHRAYTNHVCELIWNFYKLIFFGYSFNE